MPWKLTMAHPHKQWFLFIGSVLVLSPCAAAAKLGYCLGDKVGNATHPFMCGDQPSSSCDKSFAFLPQAGEFVQCGKSSDGWQCLHKGPICMRRPCEMGVLNDYGNGIMFPKTESASIAMMPFSGSTLSFRIRFTDKAPAEASSNCIIVASSNYHSGIQSSFCGVRAKAANNPPVSMGSLAGIYVNGVDMTDSCKAGFDACLTEKNKWYNIFINTWAWSTSRSVMLTGQNHNGVIKGLQWGEIAWWNEKFTEFEIRQWTRMEKTIHDFESKLHQGYDFRTEYPVKRIDGWGRMGIADIVAKTGRLGVESCVEMEEIEF